MNKLLMGDPGNYGLRVSVSGLSPGAILSKTGMTKLANEKRFRILRTETQTTKRVVCPVRLNPYWRNQTFGLCVAYESDGTRPFGFR